MKPRRKKKRAPSSPPVDRADAQMRLGNFLDSGPKRAPRKSRGKIKKTRMELAIAEAEKRSKSGDWSDARGKAFVGLYAMCHRMVYGVPPVELDDKAIYMSAAKMATSVLHKHFADDPYALAQFIKWTWEREEGRENWAAENGKTRSRLGARFQFSVKLINDYQVDQVRRRRRRG